MTDGDMAKIEYFVKVFKIAGDAIVMFQKEGAKPVRMRLDEFLKQFGVKEQGGLFGP